MIDHLSHHSHTHTKMQRDTRLQHDSREDVMRMTPEALHTWSQHLGLSPETEALIASIRSSPPVRRVSGRAGNITGRYPSPKMGVSIQFESERVEFWAIYGMERDEDVLEFYEQSSRIPLTLRADLPAETSKSAHSWPNLPSARVRRLAW